MKVDPKVISLILYLSQWDIKSGFAHSRESRAESISKYIEEFTEGKKLHIPKSAPFGCNKKLFFKNLLDEINKYR